MALKTSQLLSTKINSNYSVYPGNKKFVKVAKKLFKMAPQVIIFPTPDRLTEVDFNRVSDRPIFYLGMASDPTYNDWVLRMPFGHYDHDLGHSVHTLLNRFRVLFVNYDVLSKQALGSRNVFNGDILDNNRQTTNALIEQNQNFLQAFKESLNELKSPMLRLIIEGLWFEAYHEVNQSLVEMNGSSLSAWVNGDTKRVFHFNRPDCTDQEISDGKVWLLKFAELQQRSEH